MRRLITILIGIAAFLGGCTASVRPIWSLVERSFIEDVTGQIPDRFPVLTQATDSSGKFSIGFLNNLDAQYSIVTEIRTDLITTINTDLRSRISTDSYDYSYFVITKHDNQFTDVRLEVPTLQDAMSKSWYRIMDGTIIPQKRVRYGPGFAFIVMVFCPIAGLLTAFVTMALLRNTWPNMRLQRDAAKPPRP